MAAPARLGCASEYAVRISEYLGAGTLAVGADVQSKTVMDAEGISRISWERRLDDTSDATVMLEKAKLSTDCCSKLRHFQPWYNDVQIWRDGAECWRGPIATRITETRDHFEISARDLTAWFGKRQWRYPYYALPGTPDLAQQADWLIKGAFQSPGGGSPWDGGWLNRPNIPAITSWTASGITTASIPVQYDNGRLLREVLDELAGYGVDWTQHVNRILLSGEAKLTSPVAGRLASADFETDLSVIVDGESAITMASVYYGQNPTDYAAVGDFSKPVLEQISRPSGTITQPTAATLANVAYGRARPPVVVVRVPDGAQLSPSAPVTLDQLVCGRRFDIAVSDQYCWQATTGYRLAQVGVTWSADDTGEQVRVSFVSLAA